MVSARLGCSKEVVHLWFGVVERLSQKALIGRPGVFMLGASRWGLLGNALPQDPEVVRQRCAEAAKSRYLELRLQRVEVIVDELEDRSSQRLGPVAGAAISAERSEDLESRLVQQVNRVVVRAEVGSGSRLAGDTMNLQKWAVNRREFHALLTGGCKLLLRLDHFPRLKYVVFLTDSQVVAANTGEFRDSPDLETAEGFPLVRLSFAFDRILEDLGRLGIYVDVSHIEGAKNFRADALSRIAESGGFKEVVFRKKDKAGTPVVQCNFITVMAEKVQLPSANLLGMPTIGARYWLYICVRKWKNWPVENSDAMLLKMVRGSQVSDPQINGVIESFRTGIGSDKFVLVNGVLLFKAPVVETYSSSNTGGWIYKLVMPKDLIKEYAESVHRQLGHVGEKSLVAAVRKSVYCLAKNPGVAEICRAVCQSCEACSVTKPGGEHRSAYGPITLPSQVGYVIGVDITQGCTVRDEEGLFGDGGCTRTPFVLSVTDKRTGFTKLRAMANATAEEVGKTFRSMLHDGHRR